MSAMEQESELSLISEKHVLFVGLWTYMREVESCLENLGADIRATRVSMGWLWEK